MLVSTKTIVRTFSFGMAAILVMVGIVIQNTVQINRYRQQMEGNYIRALQELSGHMDGISADLQKVSYAGTPAQIAVLSAGIWKEADGAKASLGNLPLVYVEMDATYRFLSQVGNYTMYLSRKTALEQEVTREERENLAQLAACAESFRQQVAQVERVLRSGEVEVAPYLEAQFAQAEHALSQAVPVSLEAGEAQGYADGYPTLIYDGPFSDHLLTHSPAMLDSRQAVSRTQAKETAAHFAGLDPVQLQEGADEDSKMPCYTYRGRYVNVGVTKQGGYVAYLLNSRTVGAQRIDIPEARDIGASYLQTKGMDSMRESYYELANGVLTVNYAYTQEDVVCYTDLIKVGVAMDNGEIVFYDARGYLNNHIKRDFVRPSLSAAEARQLLHPDLYPRYVQLALIPTAGKREALTYEFACTGLRGEDILVYINVENGAEEQILILLENEYGTLAV